MASALEIKTTANVQRLIRIFAKQYEGNPRVVLRELIQNSSDAITIAKRTDSHSSETIEIEVLDPDTRGRLGMDLAVRDSAKGMDAQEFKEYLACLGQGSKTEDLQTIGEWGIGFYSIVVVCRSAIVATRKRDGAVLAFKYVIEDDIFVGLDDETRDWITKKEFGIERQSGSTVYLDIDFNEHPQLKDWLQAKRLLTELRNFCLLVPHPIAVLDGATRETTLANLSTLPWLTSGANQDDALQEVWKALLVYSTAENYPKLSHCFHVTSHAGAEFSGVAYYLQNYHGGTNIYYKSIYVEHATDMLPTWATPITLLLSITTSSDSDLHLEVPPSRTHVVRNDAFFRLGRLLEDVVEEMLRNSSENCRAHLQGELLGTDQEHRSEKLQEILQTEEISQTMASIAGHLKNICLDIGKIMLKAITGRYSENVYKDAAIELLKRRAPGLTRDTITEGLRAHAELADKHALEEREKQKGTKEAPSWNPESSSRFVKALGQFVPLRVVIKEYPAGRQPRFTQVRIASAYLGLLDPNLLDDEGRIRLPVLDKGEPSEFLFDSEERIVIVANHVELLFLSCLASATDRFQVDLVRSTRQHFSPAAKPDEWTDLVRVFQQLVIDKNETPGDSNMHVDVARYDRTEVPLVMREVDGKTHLTINIGNRGMKSLRDVLSQALERGATTVEKALNLLVHELYHSSVFEDGAGLAVGTAHLLDVRQQALIEISDLLTELLDLRSATQS